MTTGTPIQCPHCGAANPAGGAFCETCGKALPSAFPAGPRIVSADALPQSAIGHRLVSDELVKTQKKATTALLIVAILQSLFGPVVLFLLMQNQKGPPGALMAALMIQGVVAAIFWGLWAWSRKSPLPATIVGLVLYCTLVVINVVSQMSQLANHPDSPRTGIGGLGIGIVDIIIIVILAQAIKAGITHKRMLASTEQVQSA